MTSEQRWEGSKGVSRMEYPVENSLGGRNSLWKGLEVSAGPSHSRNRKGPVWLEWTESWGVLGRTG